MAEREWFEKDYYKVLGLSSSATEKEITRAYRKLAKPPHPDTNPGSEEKFKEVSVAYDVLGDAEKRKEYDEVRRLGPAAAGFGAPAAAGRGAPTSPRATSATSATSSAGSSGGRRQRAQRGADLETAPAPGLSRRRRGRDDDGDPAEQRRVPHLQGQRRRAGHGLRHLRALPAAAACSTTTRARSRCPRSARCARVAAGASSRPARRATAPDASPRRARSTCASPPASIDGQRIRLKGKGNPGVHGGPPGDLFVDVHVAPTRASVAGAAT